MLDAAPAPGKDHDRFFHGLTILGCFVWIVAALAEFYWLSATGFFLGVLSSFSLSPTMARVSLILKDFLEIKMSKDSTDA